MRCRSDLVRGWLRKARSDLTNAELCLEQETSLDTVCFHAQQAAEKSLKAYLTHCAIEFSFVHNVEKLIVLCASHDPAFHDLKGLGQELTPYAVELRYDHEFWPPRRHGPPSRRVGQDDPIVRARSAAVGHQWTAGVRTPQARANGRHELPRTTARRTALCGYLLRIESRSACLRASDSSENQ